MHYGTYFALIANVEDPVRNYLRKLCQPIIDTSQASHSSEVHHEHSLQ
jgi:hypothetical protein